MKRYIRTNENLAPFTQKEFAAKFFPELKKYLEKNLPGFRGAKVFVNQENTYTLSA